jgi:hypothetical protein
MPRGNALEPAAAWYFPFYMYFVFALYERKNEIQNEDNVPRSEFLTKTENIKAT